MSILHRLLVEQGHPQQTKPDDKPEPAGTSDATSENPKKPKKRKSSYVNHRKGPGGNRSASPAFARNRRVTVPLSLPEYETLYTGADAQGLPISALLRKALFSDFHLARPHPEHPKREVAVERLSGIEPKIDGRTRAGKAQKARQQRKKAKG
jgi:hypothetical protein